VSVHTYVPCTMYQKTTLTFFTNLRYSVLKFWEIPNSVKALKWSRNSDANKRKRGTEWVQALADISRLALCCHSNETWALIADLPNTAQLEGTPYHYPKLHPGPCKFVGMRRGTDAQIHTQTAVVTIHFASAMPHMKSTEHHQFLIHRLTIEGDNGCQ